MLTRREMILSGLTALAGGALLADDARAASASHESHGGSDHAEIKSAGHHTGFTPVVTPNGNVLQCIAL